MRIGVLVLRHESNTFLPTPTDIGLFEVLHGDAVRERWTGTHNEMGGFIEGIERAGEEVVPVYSAVAVPGGTIPSETFDALVTRLLDEVAARGPYDAVVAAAHGAMVSERHRDADAYWLGRLRAALGPWHAPRRGRGRARQPVALDAPGVRRRHRLPLEPAPGHARPRARGGRPRDPDGARRGQAGPGRRVPAARDEHPAPGDGRGALSRHRRAGRGGPRASGRPRARRSRWASRTPTFPRWARASSS